MAEVVSIHTDDDEELYTALEIRSQLSDGSAEEHSDSESIITAFEIGVPREIYAYDSFEEGMHDSFDEGDYEMEYEDFSSHSSDNDL